MAAANCLEALKSDRLGQHSIRINTASAKLSTDLRLGRYFGLSEGYWLRLQARFDTEMAKMRLSETLLNIQPFN